MKNKTFLRNLDNWEELATGTSGDTELEKKWLSDAKKAYIKMPDVIQEVFEVFCKKQHDYGPQNIALAGPKGVTLRMMDKFSRLWNLVGMNKQAEVPANSDEALYDTAMDLADYGIILMMTLDGSWKLMSIEEAFDLLQMTSERIGEDD